MRQQELANVLNLQQVFDTATIVDQICMWNMDRYEQVYDSELAKCLLLEEVTETKEAMESDNFIEVLDGLADIFFVSIGAMWKLGYTPREIVAVLDTIEANSVAMEVVNLTDTGDSANAFARIAIACVTELEAILSDEAAAMDVLRAICIANDTKVIKRAKPTEKANIDKGDKYVPPTADLVAIVKRTFAGAVHDA